MGRRGRTAHAAVASGRLHPRRRGRAGGAAQHRRARLDRAGRKRRLVLRRTARGGRGRLAHEDGFGDPEPAARDRRLAAEIAAVIRRRFWNKRRALVADHLDHADWSEHAQIIALLAGVLPARDERACFKALVTAPGLPRAQENYWMFYLFEVYRMFGRGDLLLAKLELWKDQVR
ncbi:MAG: hypothetical protein ABIF71_09590 [Planctomycetota bacterium]